MVGISANVRFSTSELGLGHFSSLCWSMSVPSINLFLVLVVEVHEDAFFLVIVFLGMADAVLFNFSTANFGRHEVIVFVAHARGIYLEHNISIRAHLVGFRMWLGALCPGCSTINSFKQLFKLHLTTSPIAAR